MEAGDAAAVELEHKWRGEGIVVSCSNAMSLLSDDVITLQAGALVSLISQSEPLSHARNQVDLRQLHQHLSDDVSAPE